jgi:hypothetical protein
LLELKKTVRQNTVETGPSRIFSYGEGSRDQVRDYDLCLYDRNNLRVVEEAFGCVPAESQLAVLIGRAPRTDRDKQIFDQRQTELNVKVITYDEILQTQVNQIRQIHLPVFSRPSKAE